MNEKQLWAFIRSKCRGKWLAQRHEDRISVGIPDVSFAICGVGHGWVELKSISCQLSPSAIVKVPHFTESQRAWLSSFGAVGGGCFVVLAVNGYILLLTSDAVSKVGQCTWGELVSMSIYSAHKGEFNGDAFVSALKSHMGKFHVSD